MPILANVIVNDQHGFRRNKSTITNLLVFQNFISDALLTGASVDVIYTYFAKAFDKVNYQILFTKLEQIGICGSFLNWLTSFIKDHSEILLCSTGPIKDLGILFDPKLKFDCHIKIINKSHQLLGFINRNCADFTDKFALKSIYCSLVRSTCEYDSVNWSHYQSGNKSKLEKIQLKFLRFISIKCSIPREPHTSYNPLLTILNLKTFEQRRTVLDLCFLYKLLVGDIDCPDFLSRLSFNTPTHNTRTKNLFRLNLQITNYANNTSCNRLMQTINNHEIEIFNSPNVHSFKLLWPCPFNTK
ncbi:Reverse transcriptase domain-containing protein [Aphis craccivora]|uniref:Reverse transcriptase domain-containing protein n=1 Tax=Aphis craccivora TaxID=307492 RepID=A0A6G0XK29_APHCR|nr:Reverse transcriptase domain-containing protein [Aphis craccivora]